MCTTFLSDFGMNVPKYVSVNVQNNLALLIIQNISRSKCLWIIYTLRSIRTVWHMKAEYRPKMC